MIHFLSKGIQGINQKSLLFNGSKILNQIVSLISLLSTTHTSANVPFHKIFFKKKPYLENWLSSLIAGTSRTRFTPARSPTLSTPTRCRWGTPSAGRWSKFPSCRGTSPSPPSPSTSTSRMTSSNPPPSGGSRGRGCPSPRTPTGGATCWSSSTSSSRTGYPPAPRTSSSTSSAGDDHHGDHDHDLQNKIMCPSCCCAIHPWRFILSILLLDKHRRYQLEDGYYRRESDERDRQLNW